MPYQDTFFSTTFQLTNAPPGAPVGTPGAPLDLTGATFKCWIALLNPDGSFGTTLLMLSTDPGGGLVIPNPIQGLITLILTKLQTSNLPLGTLAFDVMRTDQIDPVSSNAEPQRYFGGYLYVKKPVTQL